MEKRLAVTPYLGGDAYTIADMATYPWVTAALTLMRPALGDTAAHIPAIDRWCQELAGRPAVQRGMAVPRV